MADCQVISGLVAKRDELAADMRERRQELERLAGELIHVEATIRLFDPSYRIGGVPEHRRLRRQQRFGSGECQRLVLEVLRDAAGPVTDRAIAQRLVAHKDLDISQGLGPVQKTVVAVLRRLAAKGVARSVALAEGARAWERS